MPSHAADNPGTRLHSSLGRLPQYLARQITCRRHGRVSGVYVTRIQLNCTETQSDNPESTSFERTCHPDRLAASRECSSSSKVLTPTTSNLKRVDRATQLPFASSTRPDTRAIPTRNAFKRWPARSLRAKLQCASSIVPRAHRSSHAGSTHIRRARLRGAELLAQPAAPLGASRSTARPHRPQVRRVLGTHAWT